MKQRAIYKRGSYKVVPLVVGYVVEGENGRVIFRFSPSEVSEAVETADELARADGDFVDVAA